MITFYKNRYFRFGLVALLYLLWVIWIGNYWFLLGLAVIFDIYITKKVNWSFWKKRNEKNSKVVEWLDALIFAVIAVTLINIFLFQNYKIPTGSMEKSLLIGDHLFVSKVSYGPRIPNTPLSFPFTQHTLPVLNTKSYLEWVKWPYKRLKGLGQIKRYDPVVFNFPEGDTVIKENQATSYYLFVREIAENNREQDMKYDRSEKSFERYLQEARKQVRDQYEIIVRPVDKTDNYIKRCVAIPGDTLRIIDGKIYVNGIPQPKIGKIQYNYQVFTNGTPINPKAFDRMGINKSDRYSPFNNNYFLPLTEENAEKIKKFTNVVQVIKNQEEKGYYNFRVFPHDPHYPWDQDNFGPLWIPQKGKTIDLTLENLPLYERIIDSYEKNDLQIKDSTIFINGVQAGSYTFQMDYYWMMGDNRHSSLDSRFWGFVPEDHIVGKPKYIWLSLDKDKSFLSKIRWDRMFMKVE